jgi:hypothetical protein
MDFMVVMGECVGALPGRRAKAVVAFFELGRVGALFYLLFLRPFQPHVLQVCFYYYYSVSRAIQQTYSLMCLAPSQYSNQYSQQRASPGRNEFNAAPYAHQWPSNTRMYFVNDCFMHLSFITRGFHQPLNMHIMNLMIHDTAPLNTHPQGGHKV